jgi:very-short-patch-repair endonuclease
MCKKCSCKSTANKKRFKDSFELFFKKASEKWNFKYDYSKVIYENARKKVIIICPTHGEFLQSPDAHLKHECLKCSIENNANIQRHDTNKFIEKAMKIHGKTYDYSKVNYKGNKIKVEIICKKHGSFWQAPYNHLQNKGCLFCKNKSKGEEIIKNFLQENNIIFKRQKTFKDCINPETKKRLRFDFYLPKLTVCIEYDGQQHFHPIEFWGGEKALNENIKKDKIKNEYCKNNNIRLIRTNYEENIINILKKELL